MDSRDVALTVLKDIETNNTFSNIALAKALKVNQFSDKKDRAFVTRLVEGTVETRLTLDYIINQFSKTRINKCKPLIRCILRSALYQIMYMDSVPESAAINEAVRLTKKHGFATLSGFVNGVLRNIARGKENIEYPDNETDYIKYLSVKYSVPEWLCEKLFSDYGDRVEKLLENSFEERATAIRVNELRTTREELKSMLESQGVCVQYGIYDDKALLLSGYDFIIKLPGYRQGFFTVQDESSMCMLRAAGIKQGDFVVDVCAAPGGKSTGAYEYTGPGGKVISRDISRDKLELIEENATRLGHMENGDAFVIEEYDALKPDESLYNLADVVIADLPCSGLGIMNRKNDIKYRVTAEQLEELAKLQRDILEVVCKYVRPGGRLIYSTCTINPAENEENVKWFTERHGDFSVVSGRLFLQGIDKCDGFFYSVMQREE